MKTLISTFMILCLISPIAAQQTDSLQAQIDSITTLRDSVQQRLFVLTNQLDSLKQLKLLAEVKARKDKGVYITTSTEGTIRDATTPVGKELLSVMREETLLAIGWDGAYWKVIHKGQMGLRG